MLRPSYFLALLLLLTPTAGFAQEASKADSPALTSVPELRAGFDLLYEQKFGDAREAFANWQSHHPEEPFPEVAIAASYLFEELSRQGVLTSDFFLNEKKFLRGIGGKPDPERMSRFRKALAQARQLARQSQKTNPKDSEALFALTLAAGMESNEESILRKRRLDALRCTKEANEYGKRLLAQNPEATDSYVALGMANYIIGSLGPASRFTRWFGGIHGNKKLGMGQLAKTAESGLYLKPFAEIVLALAARREKQDTLAQKLLRELTEQYPGNELFCFGIRQSIGYASARGPTSLSSLSDDADRDSGVTLSELIGFHNFHDKVKGLADINLVQPGAELSYLILHDLDFGRLRRAYLTETGRRIRAEL